MTMKTLVLLIVLCTLETIEAKRVENRNTQSVRPWPNGFIPDLQDVRNRNLCQVQCTAGNSWKLNLPSERLQVIYDDASHTLALIDVLRKIAIIFTKSVNGYALINLNNGWSTIISKATGYGIISPNNLQNFANLLSESDSVKYEYLQAVSQILFETVPTIPIDFNTLCLTSNTYDMTFYIKAIKSGNPYQTMISDNWLKHLSKVLLYRKIGENISDLPGVLTTTPYKDSPANAFDMVAALMSRAPKPIGQGFQMEMGTLVGTIGGFWDSMQLYSQTFGLFSLLQAAREGLVTKIQTDGSRSWSITVNTGSIFLITSTGVIYQNGVKVGTLDVTQDGTLVAGISATKPNLLETNFNHVQKTTGIISSFGEAARVIGKAFGFGGVIKPMVDFASNVESGFMDFMNAFTHGFASNTFYAGERNGGFLR